ncbi:MFS transporter [Tardisphaera miroshnichenkoae]
MRAANLAPLMLVTLIGVYMITTGFAFAVVAPILTPLSSSFKVSVATAAYISTFYFIGSLTMSMPAGLVLDRWGIRKAGVLGLALFLLGWIASFFAQSLLILLIGRLVVGMGAVALAIASAAAIQQWFKPEESAFPIGLWAASLPIGVAWGEVLAGIALQRYGWREDFLIGTAFAIAGLITYAAVIKPGPYQPLQNAHSEENKKQRLGDVFRSADVWKFSVAVFLESIPFMAVTTFWVTWLMKNGGISSLVLASSLASAVGAAGIFGTLLSGYVSSRIGKKKPLFVVPALAFGAALLGLVWARGLAQMAVISVAVGLTSYMPTAMMFAIPGQLVPARFAGTALGMALFFNTLAGVVGPIFIGYVYMQGDALLPPALSMFACASLGALIAQTMKTK